MIFWGWKKRKTGTSCHENKYSGKYFAMSGQSDSDGGLPRHTVSCRAVEQEKLVKLLLKELCGEGEASVSQNADTIKIENNQCRKTEQDACSRTHLEIDFEADVIAEEVEETKQENYTTEENETAPSCPSSPSVIILPNEDNAEKNAKFNLVFPYGHDFMFEGERALAVLVEKQNSENDGSCQYEDYDEWLSRITKEHSLRSVREEPTSLKDRELRGRGQVAPSRTNTTVNPASTIQYDIVSDITSRRELQPRLVVKKPEPIIKSMTVKRSLIDHNYCLDSWWSGLGSRSGSDETEHYNVNNINASLTTDQDGINLHQVYARGDETATQRNITNTMKNQNSRPRFTVKKAKKNYDETTHKELQIDHNFFADSDKVKDCNVKNNTHFSQKMDQKLANDDATTTLNENIAKTTMRSHDSRPRLTVKKPDQINKPTLVKRIENNDCRNSDKNTDDNFYSINNSYAPPFRQKNNIDQLCTSDVITKTLHQNHEPPSTTVIATPTLTVNNAKLINEPTFEGIMHIDHNYFENCFKFLRSDTIKDCNINNINSSSTPPSCQEDSKTKMSQVFTGDNLPNTLRHNEVVDVTKIRDSQSKPTVEKPDQINKLTPDKIMRIVNNVCGDAEKNNHCNIENTNSSVPLSYQSCNEICTNEKEVPVTEKKKIPGATKSQATLTTVVENGLIQLNKPSEEKRMRMDRKFSGDSDKTKNLNVDNSSISPTPHPTQDSKNITQYIDEHVNISSTPLSYQEDSSKKIGQVCTDEDLLTTLHHNEVADVTKIRDFQPKPTVKKPDQINKSTPDKIKRINKIKIVDNENKHCNIENTNSSVPFITKSRDTVENGLIQENEPSPEKRMRTDQKICGDSNKTKILNVDNSSTSPTLHPIQDSKKITQHIDENIKKSHKSQSTLVIKNRKQIKEPDKIIIIDNNNICRNSDTIRDCNINNTSSSPQKNDQVSIKKDEIIATLQNIALNIKKSRELRPRLVVNKSKHLNKPRLINKPQVSYYGDADKTKDNSVSSIEDETILSDKDNFEWSTSMDSFQGVKESFAITQTGSVASHSTIYDAFRAFWDDDILNTIARETNTHAKSASMSVSFKKQCYDTNMHEILILFSFWIMLGIIRMPTIKSCFSSDPLLKVNVFRTIFTKLRYDNLVTALSFANNDDKTDSPSELQCISPILEHLNEKFQSNFIPCQNISIDESCLPCDDSHTVHTMNKTVNFGIKTLELSDNATGYLWSFLIHLEKDERENVESQPDSKYNASVLKLIKPLLNKGYTLYMNSLLNSPILARFLKKNKTDCIGKIAPLSDGLPPFEGLANMNPRQFLAQHAKDVCVIAWHNKNIIYYISTCHGTGPKFVSHNDDDRGAKGWMPQMVVDCETNLGVVSNENQMLEPYVTEKNRCDRWHLKLFKRLLNFSVMNAQILLESSKKMKVDHLAARLQLVNLILEKHLSLCPVLQFDSRQSSNLTSWREIGHWPVLYKLDPTSHTNRHDETRCVYCFSRGIRHNKTRYKCEQCDVPLCVLCFKGYHSQPR